MTNMKLIEKAVELVIEFYESESIMEETNTIRARATAWYNKTDITDAQMLAAATMTGEYQVGVTWNELLSWKEFYFPTTPIQETINKINNELSQFEKAKLMELENFHISEIEAAQRDVIWQ